MVVLPSITLLLEAALSTIATSYISLTIQSLCHFPERPHLLCGSALAEAIRVMNCTYFSFTKQLHLQSGYAEPA